MGDETRLDQTHCWVSIYKTRPRLTVGYPLLKNMVRSELHLMGEIWSVLGHLAGAQSPKPSRNRFGQCIVLLQYRTDLPGTMAWLPPLWRHRVGPEPGPQDPDVERRPSSLLGSPSDTKVLLSNNHVLSPHSEGSHPETNMGLVKEYIVSPECCVNHGLCLKGKPWSWR